MTFSPFYRYSLLLYYVQVLYFCYSYVKSGRAGANISLFMAYVPSSPNYVRGVIPVHRVYSANTYQFQRTHEVVSELSEPMNGAKQIQVLRSE